MKGKRKRSKRYTEMDLPFRATCPHAPSGDHKPRPDKIDRTFLSGKSEVMRMDSVCVWCRQTITAYQSPGGEPIWRSQRFVIEEVPW